MMIPIDKRELFLHVVHSHLGKPYSWGGDDPIIGFDCSGLVVEGLKAVGLMERKSDNTAKGIYHDMANQGLSTPKCGPYGSLVFWCRKGDGSEIFHVEVVYCTIDNEVFTIGASGGGSKTTSIEKAISHNAFVKIRPLTNRGAHLLYADPFIMTV